MAQFRTVRHQKTAGAINRPQFRLTGFADKSPELPEPLFLRRHRC
jgi:hypothetical protein